jgi:predicted lipid-binding transport protein (Tim44 family)
MTKTLALALSIAIAATASLALPQDAFAKRMGGGGSSGMQRSMPARPAGDALPAKPAQAPTAAPAAAGTGAAAAAAPRRSWLGPIAGLAAGLGLAALFSHLGLGAELANFVMIALLVAAAFFAIRFLMRRFGSGAMQGKGLQPAAAGAFGGSADAAPSRGTAFEALRPAPAAAAQLGGGSSLAPAVAGAAATAIPADFDTEGFERIAKMIFIRMQTANDAGDLDDLRAFTTPEMFASVRSDLHERGDVVNRTDVVQVDAQVLDVATEAGKQVVSVRFHGLIREVVDGTADPFDEIWHLVKPLDGSREWAIAGIQQTA